MKTTAHHLARNLGASFDSFTDINCLADEYYIMSPLLNSTVSGLKHKLSECSVRELKKILISNGQASSIAQCLTNPALAFNLVTEKNNLTGLFFGANDQCKMIHGSAATFVQVINNLKKKSLFYDIPSILQKTCAAKCIAVKLIMIFLCLQVVLRLKEPFVALER